MADLTRAQMSTRILEYLGVLGAGQSADANDDARVKEAIDSGHERLRKMGLAPFATTAIPEWAQIPFRDWVAYDVAGLFGLQGERLALVAQNRTRAERELSRQLAGRKVERPVRGMFF